MSFLTPRTLAVLGLMAAYAVPAVAEVVITDVTPSDITVGTEIVITGTGFGTKKPKLSTEPTVAGAKPPSEKFQVTSVTDTEIRAVVKKIHKDIGSSRRNLIVSVKGEEPGLAVDALRIVAPVITDVSPAGVAPGAEVTITGNNFGTKKGKVSVGAFATKAARTAYPAKVLSWTNDTIRIRLSKKQPDGNHTVSVTNTVGTTIGGGVTTTSPISGADILKGRFLDFIATDRVPDQVTATPIGTVTGLSVFAVDNGKGGNSATITINLDLGAAPDTLTFPITYQDASIVVGQTIVGRGFPPQITINGWGLEQACSVTITSYEGGRVKGSFECSLPRTAGSGANPLAVSGEFLATLVQ